MPGFFTMPKLKVRLRGNVREFDLGRYTAAESQLYQQFVGVGMLQGLESPELHTILGFAWLEERRRNNKLSWPKFSAGYSWADLELLDDSEEDEASSENDEEGPKEDLDPTGSVAT